VSGISGWTIIVTGASSGIGAAAGRRLAADGAKVALAARRTPELESIAGGIRAEGGEAVAISCDVSRREDVERLVSETENSLGPVDAIVNNAGVMPLSPFSSLRVDDWDRMVDVNIKGVLYGIAAVLPGMLERGRGHIVNISSTAGRRVFPTGGVYCGTKHAVHAISEGLRAELAQKNIRVSVVAPGIVLTELQSHIADAAAATAIQERINAMDPLLPEDVGEAISWALCAPHHVSVNEILVRPTRQET